MSLLGSDEELPPIGTTAPTLGVVKVGSGHANAWIGYGERSDAAHPERSNLPIRIGPRPEAAPRRH